MATPNLYIVAIDPNGTIIPLKQINTTPLTDGPHTYTNTSVTLSLGKLPVEQYKIAIAVRFYDNSKYISDLNISNFELSTPTRGQLNSPDNVFYEPDFTENFTNNDYNALLGNAFIPRYSEYFMDVDYSTSPIIGSSLTPINFDQLIAGTATRAPIQDYYYNLRRHIIPRYLGSKSTAPSFNTFSTSSKNKGFGKDIVAGNPKPFVGYYGARGGSTPEVIGKTIINLDYIIDENIQTQVPALSDFTYNNQIQLFERGTYLYLDPDKKASDLQFSGNRKYKIYRSGEYATPILYSQTGSNPGFLPSLSFIPPGEAPIDTYYDTKATFYQNNAQSNATYYYDTNSFFRLFRRVDGPYFSAQGQPYDSFATSITTPQGVTIPVNSNPYDTTNVGQYKYPSNIGIQTWNQLVFNPPVSMGSNVSFATVGNLPSTFKIFNFTNVSSVPSDIQFKAKTSITMKWEYSYANGTEGVGAPFNIRLQLRIVALPANGYAFNVLAGGNNNFVEIASGETKTFEIETPILTPGNTLGGLMVQGRILLPTTGFTDPAYNTKLYNDYQSGASILSSNFEIIQVPQNNQTVINYSSQNPYITSINDSTNGINSGATVTSDVDFYSGNIPCSQIYLNPSFVPALGQIYPQVPGSGYDSTIYPFEISPNSIFNTTSTPEYEIRFNADENLVFPIIGSYVGEYDGDLVFWLIVGRPEGYSLQDNIVGDARQSFLIRRWIPRAGYIYLDVAADLGAGIVKPEYITDGIKNKIPQIVKELTDKGLIQ